MKVFGRIFFLFIGMWSNLVRRLIWVQEIVGSNPVIPTKVCHLLNANNTYKRENKTMSDGYGLLF